MTPITLEPEEKELRDSFERGQWHSVDALPDERARYQGHALAALQEKSRQVSITLPVNDLEAIQRRAREEGIPYQTLIANLVHQYLAGRPLMSHEP